ncbi:MAG: hypothetical protein R3E97_19640 [Candidatus Eisenbacteria bacterium]
MQRYVYWCFLLCVVAVVGCSDEHRSTPTTPDPSQSDFADPQALANALIDEAGWTEGGSTNAIPQRMGGVIPLFHFERTPIVDDVVHYSVQMRVGPGPYDRIGLHRVVREQRPYQPIRTDRTLFLVHGDLKDFTGMFLPGQFSPNRPNDFGVAAFLAENDVDVWGIDQGWNFVPQEEANFAFFADWGLQKEVDNLAVGVSVAQLVRLATGNGHGKMNLLGYSSGGMTGYALLNQEAQRPPVLRKVGGYIAADMGVRSDDPLWLEFWQGWVAIYESLHQGGQYEDPLIFREASLLARSNPDDASPFFDGFTNLEVALFFAGGPVYAPTVAHYHAPILEDEFPVDLQFVTVPQWLDFLEDTAAYQPILFALDWYRIAAGLDSPFTDHLSSIDIPVFDLGAAGGIGPYTSATVSYLGSNDITQLYVSTGASDQALDFGHIDLFTAENSPELVWTPILDWVAAHSD